MASYEIMRLSPVLGSQEAKVCGTKMILCALRAERTLFSSGAASRCDCLLSCGFTLVYSVEPSVVDFDLRDAASKSIHAELTGSEK